MLVLSLFTLLLFMAVQAERRFAQVDTEMVALRRRLERLETRREATNVAAVPGPRITRTSVPPPTLAATVAPTGAQDRTPLRAPVPVPVSSEIRPSFAPPQPALAAAPAAVPVLDSLETRIGSRWLLYVGVVAIVVGVSYFEKLALDNHWVSDTARILQSTDLRQNWIATNSRIDCPE